MAERTLAHRIYHNINKPAVLSLFLADSRERPPDQSNPFFNRDDLVAFQLLYICDRAAWPDHFDCVHSAPPSQSEMQARILRGLITHSTLTLVMKYEVAGGNFHSCADSVAIRLSADQKNLEPMVRIAAIVAQQLRGLAAIIHENIEIAIIVEVGDGSATANARQLKIHTKPVADVFENSVTGIAEHHLRFGILRIRVVKLDVVEDVSIGQEEISRTVVVVIHEARAEGADAIGRISNFRT